MYVYDDDVFSISENDIVFRQIKKLSKYKKIIVVSIVRAIMM